MIFDDFWPPKMSPKPQTCPIFELKKRYDFHVFRDAHFSKNVVLRKREHHFEGSSALTIFRKITIIWLLSKECFLRGPELTFLILVGSGDLQNRP